MKLIKYYDIKKTFKYRMMSLPRDFSWMYLVDFIVISIIVLKYSKLGNNNKSIMVLKTTSPTLLLLLLSSNPSGGISIYWYYQLYLP